MLKTETTTLLGSIQSRLPFRDKLSDKSIPCMMSANKQRLSECGHLLQRKIHKNNGKIPQHNENPQ